MNLKELHEKLKKFGKEIEEVYKISQNEVEYDSANPEEQFWFDELVFSVLENIQFAKEAFDYLSVPVAYEGILNEKYGKFFINDLLLEPGDTIEVLSKNKWIKVEIYKVNNEYYASLTRAERFREDNLTSRIRLTESELANRLQKKAAIN